MTEETAVPLFTVWREFDPSWGTADFEMMQVRAIATGWFDQPFRWQRSYGFQKLGIEQGFCVYQGNSAPVLAQQQLICWVPFTEVREVVEVCGDSRGLAPDVAPESSGLYFVERTLAAGSDPDSLAVANRSAVFDGSHLTWLRSYWDQDKNNAKCIFAAQSEVELKRVVALPGMTVERFEQVETNHPANWADTYDRLGLPRHWEMETEDCNADIRDLARA